MAIRFAIAGDLRFISHHDTMRLFERALSRARLPVKYSQGYNPRPRLSLPLPRPVGIASDSDVLVVELEAPVEPVQVLQKLAEQMPGGMTLASASLLEGGRALQAVSADYVLPFGPGGPPGLAEAVARLWAADSWPVQRIDAEGRAGKTVDVRAFLEQLSLDEVGLRWRTRVSGGGSIRPGEVLTALGLEPQVWHHHIRRTSIRWLQEQAAPEGLPSKASE